MTTKAWSPYVDDIWDSKDGSHSVVIIAEHTHAKLIRVKNINTDEEYGWWPNLKLLEEYNPSICELCGSTKKNYTI